MAAYRVLVAEWLSAPAPTSSVGETFVDAVTVVNAPEFGVVLPMVPGTSQVFVSRVSALSPAPAPQVSAPWPSFVSTPTAFVAGKVRVDWGNVNVPPLPPDGAFRIVRLPNPSSRYSAV